MQLITLNEALQWKGSCVARVCALGGEGIFAWHSQILLV